MNREIIRNLRDADIPLLSNSQIEFLDLLNAQIENIVGVRSDNNDAFPPMVLSLEDDLNSIVKNLRVGRSSRNQFRRAYPKWIKHREDGIQRMIEIANSINKDRFNCNVSKIVGYSTSIIGAAVTIASAIAIPFTLGLSTPLAIAGGVTTGAGASTAFGTSVTETLLLNSKVKEAQEIIKKDKKYFQKMHDWLEHADELQKVLESIMSIDVVKEINDRVKDMVNKALKIPNQLERIQYLKNTLNRIFTRVPQETVKEVPLSVIGALLLMLAAIYLLFKHGDNRLIFDSAAITIRSVLGIASLLDDSMDCVRLSSLFVRTAGGEAAVNLAKAVTRGAVAVIGIALDIAGLALASIDIHKGSLSPQAEKISEAAEEMTDEAELITEIYKNMFR